MLSSILFRFGPWPVAATGAFVYMVAVGALGSLWPGTPAGFSGGGLIELLGNNLLALLLTTLVGFSWHRCNSHRDRTVIGALAGAVLVSFAVRHAPVLGGYLVNDGLGAVTLALAPHAPLELASLAVAAIAPKRWPEAAAGVIVAAAVEAWLSPIVATLA